MSERPVTGPQLWSAFRDNLRRAIGDTGRSQASVAAQAWPESTEPAATRKLERLLAGDVWPRADDLARLAAVLPVEEPADFFVLPRE